MPRKAARRATGDEGYWSERLRSGAFKRALAGVAVDELQALARQRVRDVVDPAFVRTMIRELDTRVIDRAIVADLVIEAQRRVAARLDRQQRSLLDLVDPQLVAEIEAAMAGDGALSPRAEQFVADLMGREFVRGLLTDVIYTAIVSFNRRVNPIFGAFATNALEEQIKGFIRLVMPMLQAQAIAFAVDRRNQRIVLDFAGTVVRQLLEVPLGSFAGAASSADSQRIETVIRRAVTNAKLGTLARTVALALWDDLYRAISARRVGDLLRIEQHAAWLANRLIEMLSPALSRPHIVRFIAAEMNLARGPRPRAKKRGSVSTAGRPRSS